MRLKQSVDTVFYLILVGILAYLLIRPGGPVRHALQEWRAEAAKTTLIAQEWPRLADLPLQRRSPEQKVIAVVFSDYQCPYCRQSHKILTDIEASRPDVQFVFRHLPIPTHLDAEGAARASICAEEYDAFYEMHSLLFETVAWQRDRNWIELAAVAGVSDTSGFRQCLAAKRTSERLQADLQWAQLLGVTATPTFVLERRFQRGMMTREMIEAVLPEPPAKR